MDEIRRFELRSCKNWHVLKVIESDGTTEEIVQCGDSHEAFAAFLWELADSYGPQRDSFGPRNINIDIKPGRKYECNFTYAGVRVQADEPTDAAGTYASELMNEVHFFKKWKIPLDYISIQNGTVKGHEKKESQVY